VKMVLGVAIIALALAIIAVPQFTSCGAQGRVLTLANGKTTPMKCTWTARAEIATGVPILGVGSLMLFARRKESLRYLGLLGMILGVLVMLLPTTLIGVCSGSMPCNTVMRPSLLTFGAFVTAASLTAVALSLKEGE
jgi:hypothetical protein